MMDINIYPQEVNLSDISLRLNKIFEDESPKMPVTLKFQYQIIWIDEKHFGFETTLEINKDRSFDEVSIQGHLSLYCVFVGEESITREHLEESDPRSFASFMSPYLIETCASVTRRMGFPPLLIPPITRESKIEKFTS